MFVSLLREYDADLPSAKYFWILLNTSNYSNFSYFCTEWLLDCRSRVAYERKQNNKVFYVLPAGPRGQRNQLLESYLSFQLAIQEQFHIPCGSAWGTLSEVCRCSILFKGGSRWRPDQAGRSWAKKCCSWEKNCYFLCKAKQCWSRAKTVNI